MQMGRSEMSRVKKTQQNSALKSPKPQNISYIFVILIINVF